jgi:hypothetical protein
MDIDLVAWLHAALDAAGVSIDAVDQSIVDMVLALAGNAAHNVVRPAAPIATFALGLAASGLTTDEMSVVARRITEAANTFPVETDAATEGAN